MLVVCVRVDVPAAPAATATAAAPALDSSATYTELPLSNVRKVIAARLLESKTTIPHYYLTTECAVDELLRFVS